MAEPRVAGTADFDGVLLLEVAAGVCASHRRSDLRTGALELGRTKPAYKAIRARVALEWRKHDLDSNVPSRGAGSVTESLREARVDADERVQTAAFAFYTAEAVFNAQVEAARLHRSEISALQSILADLRPMVSER
jgi:hypothetical protein